MVAQFDEQVAHEAAALMCIKLGRSSPTGQSTEDAPANETSLPRLATAVGLTRAQWPPPRPPPLQPHAQEPVKQLQPRGPPPQRGLPLQRELPPQRGLPQPQPKRQRSATPPFAHPSSSSSSPHSEAGDFPCTQDSQGNVAVPPALLEEPPHDDEARLQEHGDAEAIQLSQGGASVSALSDSFIDNLETSTQEAVELEEHLQHVDSQQ